MGPLDVTPEQLRKQAMLYDRLSDLERARVINDLFWAGRRLAEAGLRERHREASPALLDWLLIEELYGPSVATRLRGARPAQ